MDENIFFKEATFKICSSLNINTALENLITYIKDFMPITDIVMSLYQPEFNTGRVIAGVSISGNQSIKPIIQVPHKLWEKTAWYWKEEVGISRVNNYKEEEDYIQELTALIWDDIYKISTIGMDLEIDSERVGHVVFKTEGQYMYTEHHEHLVSLLHDPLAIAMSNILRHQELIKLKDLISDDNKYLRKELYEISGDKIIGSEFGLKNVMEMVRQVAPIDSPTLLLGETGVGKEVIANAIHYSSKRRNGPFIRVNCGAIPDNLIDSELFGYEKGAFTGAVSRKRGRFERADKGTIFLDEIGELPPQAQIRLLRVLQNKEIERVGGSETIPVDVRIISATHRNLEEMTKSGGFREDLWFRLNVFPIIIPPLRHRKEDIPELVNHFIQRKSMDLKIINPPYPDKNGIERLKEYPWPGNVRELENMIERELIQSLGKNRPYILVPENKIDFKSNKNPDIIPQKEDLIPLDDAIKKYIETALFQTNGKVEGDNGAASLLKLNPSTLRGKMKKYGIRYN